MLSQQIRRAASKGKTILALQNTKRHFNAFRPTLAMRKPATDNFANGTSAVYVDQQYEDWRIDPNSVHSSWRAYFENIEGEAQEPYQAPPSIGKTGGNDV
jgi:2-oxoglutarate dehydrogenase E1 component